MDTTRSTKALAVLMALSGCGAGDGRRGDAPEAELDPAEVDWSSHELSVGSRGPEVRALHAWLVKYGYFPNEETSQTFPGWRAAVNELPAVSDTFDEQTAKAVSSLQRFAGVATTGRVDAETRTIVHGPRCGNPDDAAAHSDKFARHATRWSGNTLTWRLMNTNGIAAAEGAVRSAFASWAAVTQLTFNQRTSGTADIQLTFGEIDDRSNPASGTGLTLARASNAANGGDITIDHDEIWSVASVTPAGAQDLQTIVLHEIGHALGLRHSSVDHGAINRATMRPTFAAGAQDRSLAADDMVGISSWYDAWEQLPGSALDIGAGGGLRWVVGTAPVQGGFSIHLWNGSNWTAVSGGAVAIAVAPSGVPWVVNSLGEIYERTSSSATSGAWNRKPGCARDIGIGSNGAVWVIGCVATTGGFTIHRWNGANWDAVPGGGIRIAADNQGRPWIVNASNEIFRLVNNAWELLPGRATDISVDEHGYAFVTGVDARSGGFGIYLFNEQGTLLANDGSEAAPARFEWISMTTTEGGVNIAADRSSVWIVNNSLAIKRTVR